jgi:hypothetical protein
MLPQAGSTNVDGLRASQRRLRLRWRGLGHTVAMIFTPLRKAVIAGAGMLAIGAAGGVAVHAATAGSPSATPTAATASPSPSGDRDCAPKPLLGAARQVLDIAASVTGLSRDQILDQLRQGRTLDQIAGDKASTIESQALAKLRAALDKRVSSGKLTAAREATMLDQAKAALEKAMSANLSAFIPADGAMPRACGRRGGGLLATLIKVTAQKTGLSEQQVMQDLRNGESIDQIAGSKAADIKATVLQMEQQRMSGLLDKLMSHSGGMSGRGHRGGDGGFGQLFGGGSSATPAA